MLRVLELCIWQNLRGTASMSQTGANSPDVGSPSGGQPFDGAQIAIQMIQATNAAAMAAQSAADALQKVQSQSASSGVDDKSWYKLLPRPSALDPSSREEEISKWRDWPWTLEQYLGTLDPRYVEEFAFVRSHLTNPVDVSIQSDEEKKRGIFLYNMLASLLKQRPLLVLKAIPDFNGFECYRQLISSNEPINKNRSMGLLNIIMNWPVFNQKVSYLSQIMKLEAAFAEYSKINSAALSEDLRSAVLLRCVTGQLKTWIQLRIDDSTTYSEIRESILGYERSTTKWSEQMILGSAGDATSTGEGAVPMEVDFIQKGKKGKSKYKSDKGKQRGQLDKGDNKGKGKQQKGKYWDNGKGYGQQTAKGKGYSWYSSNTSNWDQLRDHSKGSYSSYNSGKGYGNWNQWNQYDNKGKSKGKAKSKDGKGKVRQVAIDSTQQPDKPDSSTQCNSSSQQPQARQVNRVAFSMGEFSSHSSSLFFDISGDDLREAHNVSMISILTEHSDQHPCDSVCTPAAFDNVMTLSSSCDACFGAMACEQYCSNVYGLFSLPDLHVLDDFNHFSNSVAQHYGFDFYDRIVDEQHLRRELGPTNGFRPRMFIHCNNHFHMHSGDSFCDVGSVRAMSFLHDSSQSCDIILDSGSDATVLPTSLIHAGVAASGPGAQLLDAQGKAIGVSDVRDIVFQFQTEDGSLVQVKDRALFSNAVSHPIISYGKLLRNGWGIQPGNDGSSFLTHHSGHRVAVGLRQNSLVLQGHVRVVSTVRAIEVDIPRSWQSLRNGWYDLPDGTPICSSPADTFIDPAQNNLVHEWPYRTTVAMSDTGQWFVIELCEKYFYMQDRSQPIKDNYRRLLTLLTKSVVSTSDFGMMVVDSHLSSSVASQSSNAPALVPDDPMIGEGGASTRKRTADSVSQALSGDPQPSSNLEAPVGLQSSADGSVPSSIAIQANLADSGVTIAGVQIFPTSAIAVLRAACKHLQISQSGSKSKLW